MAVTAQQIAELAGVSRGSVDRALHNRGRVNPEVAKQDSQNYSRIGYKPNLIGQAPVKSTRSSSWGDPAIHRDADDADRTWRQRAAETCRLSVELIMRENRGLDRTRTHLKSQFQGVQGWLSHRITRRRFGASDELYEQAFRSHSARFTGQQASYVHRYGQLPRRTDRRRLASADAAHWRQGASTGGTLE